MSLELNYADIQHITQDRAELEVGMCQALLEIYNSKEVLEPIKKTIGFAFENIAGTVILPAALRKDSAKGYGEAIKEGCGESKKLRVFAKHGGGERKDAQQLWDGCKKIFEKQAQWDAADCSDLSRFMGSVLEKMPAGVASDFDRLHGQLKPDELYKNYDPFKPGPKPAQPSRTRTGDAGYKPPPTHATAGRQVGLNMRIHHDEKGELVAGIGLVRLMPESTVRKIDLAFGLPEGADISGTTSDSIIVNRLVARFCDSLPEPYKTPATTQLLQLLPLVTMISYGHHSVLESALTLTLFGVCDYHIGFYTTLLAQGAIERQRAKVGGEILRILKDWESDKRNRHVLCWWESSWNGLSGKYRGVEYRTPSEIKEYRRIARTSKGFLTFFRDRVHTAVYERDLQPLVKGEVH